VAGGTKLRRNITTPSHVEIATHRVSLPPSGDKAEEGSDSVTSLTLRIRIHRKATHRPDHVLDKQASRQEGKKVEARTPCDDRKEKKHQYTVLQNGKIQREKGIPQAKTPSNSK
jgi:hypothetical protein